MVVPLKNASTWTVIFKYLLENVSCIKGNGSKFRCPVPAEKGTFE
jgi:hypothetical protein